MDGRFIVVGLTIVLPAILLVAAVAWFNTNPLSVLVLFAVMLIGALYLLSYTETFSGTTS
ncbi:MAG: hypothetical protein L3K14_07820 [Thermoplasmata archaeon]|nr:hypothetical protein [Thermoplasmata archaeon]